MKARNTTTQHNSSNEERKAMGLAGRKRMEELFDKEKVVRETIQRLKREVPEVERKPDQHHCAGI